MDKLSCESLHTEPIGQRSFILFYDQLFTSPLRERDHFFLLYPLNCPAEHSRCPSPSQVSLLPLPYHHSKVGRGLQGFARDANYQPRSRAPFNTFLNS